MIIIISIALAIIIGFTLGLILRKVISKAIKLEIEEILKNKGTTLKDELQRFIDLQNKDLKIQSISGHYVFKYNNAENTCIIVKFKIDGQNETYIGIVSDSGSYTEFEPFNILCSINALKLLQKIYKQPKKEINEENIIYLPKLENIYNFNIQKNEKVIFNSRIKKIKTENNISIGLNVKFTMTDKKIYIYNGVGLWTIDLYEDISDYKRHDMCIDIALSELCIFGSSGERMCTGFKLYFNNDDINKLEEILNSIIK